ncbi:MAG: AbrB/MazE/SpoVT family DNA-binding domain-containing protein [Thermomicrobiales bacterium]
MVATTRIEQGSVRIPEELQEKFGLAEGAMLVAEANDDGIMLRPIVETDVEIYTPERIAEFLLSNAMDKDDYESAAEEVRRMGLDPESIDHYRPCR